MTTTTDTAPDAARRSPPARHGHGGRDATGRRDRPGLTPASSPTCVFVHLRLHEPDKATLAAFELGRPMDQQVDRAVEALLVPKGRLEAIDVVVSVTSGEIRSWTVHEGMRSGAAVRRVAQRDPRRSRASRLAGRAAPPRHRGLRPACRSTRGRPARSASPTRTGGASAGASATYARRRGDNGYARPIEGVIAFFDQGAGEVLEVLDLGVVPLPPERGLVPARRRRARCAPT